MWNSGAKCGARQGKAIHRNSHTLPNSIKLEKLQKEIVLYEPKTALDGNQNATAPSLPVVPPVPRKPIEPDPLVKMFPKNIPHWFVITYTYSVVLIMILLIANVTPDGKLYIHFTAFWSLILYFVLEDDQVLISYSTLYYLHLTISRPQTYWTL